jgi:transposase
MCAPLLISAASPARRSATILKAGITKACFHEPQVNQTYADMARHYGTAIVPARPYKPRDKAKVEVGVQVVGRWILARLRHPASSRWPSSMPRSAPCSTNWTIARCAVGAAAGERFSSSS